MIPTEPVADLLRRLDVARRASPPGALLAFDADGTLWEGDVGCDTFAALLEARGVRDDARAALADEAARHGVAAGGDAHAVARALYEAYFAGSYPEDRACAMMAWAFAGYRRHEYEAFAAAVVGRAGLVGRLQAEVEPVLAWARDNGVAVWIVSASPRASVEAGARAIGLDPGRVVAVTPAEAPDGTLLPRVVEPMPYDEGKAQTLGAATAGAPVLAAFGNGGFDAPMLHLAALPVAVRPSPALLARLAGLARAVTLEPAARAP